MLTKLFSIRSQQRSINNPAIPLSGDNVLEYLGGESETDSGIRIGARSSLNYPPVWQAVSMISGDIAKLPLQKKIKRGRETIVDERHPTHFLVSRKPNEKMHAFKFWRRLMVHLCLWNHAYAWIRFGSSGPVELLPLLPDRTKWVDEEQIYVTEIAGQIQGLAPSQVLHFENFSVDGKSDCELVKKARDSWALGLAAQKFASRFFKQGAQSGGYLEIPPAMTKKAADNLVEGIYSKTGPNNWFRAMVLRDGAKFHETTINAEDSQLNELRETQVRDVSRWFNLPPSRLGLSDSQSYNSKYEDNKNYLSTTLSPHLCTIRSECWMKLLTDDEQREDIHQYRHDTSELLELDPQTAASIGQTEVEMGAMSPNEYLISRGRNPRPGGDYYITPMNMDKEIPGSTPSAETPVDVPTEFDIKDAVKAANAARKVANHLRKEVKRKQANRFVNWVDKSLDETLTECFRGVKRNLYGDFCGQAKRELETLLESVSEQQLASAVIEFADRMEQWNVAPTIGTSK